MRLITYLPVVYFQIGSTALFHACLRGHVKAAKRLICDPRINLRLLRVSHWKASSYSLYSHSVFFFQAHKVHIFWEGHKILRYFHLTFVLCSASQKILQNFVAFSEYMNFRVEVKFRYSEKATTFWKKIIFQYFWCYLVTSRKNLEIFSKFRGLLRISELWYKALKRR